MMWFLFTFLINTIVSYAIPSYATLAAVIRKEPIDRWLVFWILFIIARIVVIPLLDMVFECYLGRILVGIACLGVSAMQHEMLSQLLAAKINDFEKVRVQISAQLKEIGLLGTHS